MFPIMCSHPACRNIALIVVNRCRPAATSAGIPDPWPTKAPPPANSSRKAMQFITMIAEVTVGNRLGRLVASAKGIMVAIAILHGSAENHPPCLRFMIRSEECFHHGPHQLLRQLLRWAPLGAPT